MITFRTIILSALIVEKVKQLTGLIAWDDRDMWNTPLSPTGELPATHYISQATWVAIQNIESLFSLMDVSEQSSNEALLRLNLKLCENID